MIERIHTNQRMSKIVKHQSVVYLCGQVGSGDTIQEQTKDCLNRIENLLEEAGSSPSKILQAIVWLSDMKYFNEMNSVWDSWLPSGEAPARACGEAKLANDDLLVEIIITAAI